MDVLGRGDEDDRPNSHNAIRFCELGYILRNNSQCYGYWRGQETYIGIVQCDTGTRKYALLLILRVHRKADTALLQRSIHALMRRLDLKVRTGVAFAGNIGDLADLDDVLPGDDVGGRGAGDGGERDDGAHAGEQREKRNEGEGLHCERNVRE